MIDRAIEHLIENIKRNTISGEMFVATLQVMIGTFVTLGATLVAIGSGYALAMQDSTGADFSRNWITSAEYYTVGLIILFIGVRLFQKAFFKQRRKKGNDSTQSPKLRILVDEMLDGTDDALRNMGYEVYSVKKLREGGQKLQSDYSILKYAETNNMVLITEDDQNIEGCKENGIRVIKYGQGDTFENLTLELKKFHSG